MRPERRSSAGVLRGTVHSVPLVFTLAAPPGQLKSVKDVSGLKCKGCLRPDIDSVREPSDGVECGDW
jgi:hypothetical protein